MNMLFADFFYPFKKGEQSRHAINCVSEKTRSFLNIAEKFERRVQAHSADTINAHLFVHAIRNTSADF